MRQPGVENHDSKTPRTKVPRKSSSASARLADAVSQFPSRRLHSRSASASPRRRRRRRRPRACRWRASRRRRATAGPPAAAPAQPAPVGVQCERGVEQRERRPNAQRDREGTPPAWAVMDLDTERTGRMEPASPHTRGWIRTAGGQPAHLRLRPPAGADSAPPRADTTRQCR